MHDETYKKLFAFPRMVGDLLRGFVAGLWVEDIGFSTLRKLSSPGWPCASCPHGARAGVSVGDAERPA